MATPIGNAADVTLRALAVLRGVDAIACEDTRVTRRLLGIHGIDRPLLAYHEHNAARMRPALLARVRAGESIALVSDAGTPLVSDPGYKLVREAVAEGLPVTALPGPSAPMTALVLSGLPTDRFLFAGFLPPKEAARRAALAELRPVRATLLFFESAQRLPEMLAAAAEVLGGREAAVARELTKLFEEVRRGTLAGLAAHYAEAGPPRGEIVVAIGPPAAEGPAGPEEVDAALVEALGRLSVKDAAAEVAQALGAPRREVYARAVELARGVTGEGPARGRR